MTDKKKDIISKMNCRWRLIILLTILLIVCGTIYFIYNRPKQQGSKFELSDKIRVSVYYEALCPDSKHFIRHQLNPLYEKLSEHIEVELIPYGKARTIESEGSITFQCQHDEIECYANRIHACGIDLIHDNSLQMKYISCMIKNNENPEEIASICGKKYDIDFTQVLKCAKDEQGNLLLKRHGERTSALNPTVRFIPTIELNGDQELAPQTLILKNFEKAICGLFKNKPAKCDY